MITIRPDGFFLTINGVTEKLPEDRALFHLRSPCQIAENVFLLHIFRAVGSYPTLKEFIGHYSQTESMDDLHRLAEEVDPNNYGIEYLEIECFFSNHKNNKIDGNYAEFDITFGGNYKIKDSAKFEQENGFPPT